ncbi:MAG TPA: hypothetical protein V6D08_13795 [Candidatus Obscuribacterales bacterium]
MVTGDVGLADLPVALKPAENRLTGPVNAVVLTTEEAREKHRAKHHFLETVLKTKKPLVIGNKDELADVIGEQTGQATPDKPG